MEVWCVSSEYFIMDIAFCLTGSSQKFGRRVCWLQALQLLRIRSISSFQVKTQRLRKTDRGWMHVSDWKIRHGRLFLRFIFHICFFRPPLFTSIYHSKVPSLPYKSVILLHRERNLMSGLGSKDGNFELKGAYFRNLRYFVHCEGQKNIW